MEEIITNPHLTVLKIDAEFERENSLLDRIKNAMGKLLAHDIVLTEIIEERFDFGMEVEAIA